MTDLPDPGSTKPRVRFAPSPTGFLHVGSARTLSLTGFMPATTAAP